jgi:2-succinyl-6-hydroxy-2,4-cyclohexadiene-1-carboxylate synthase
MSLKVRTILLHGFLGEPSDWYEVLTHLHFPQNFIAVDLYRNEALKPTQDIQDWPKQFLTWHQDLFGSASFNLVGYSMGGRLALEVFKQAPENLRKLVVVSSHVGLTTVTEKTQRLSHDQVWADQFRTQGFDKTLSAWNAQAVFTGGQIEPSRKKQERVKEAIAQSLEFWSLGHQAKLELQKLDFSKLDFIIGALDEKFKTIYKEANIQVSQIPKAGHRVLFDNPVALANSLQTILSN